MTERRIHETLLTRRDALLRVGGALLGGAAFVGQAALLSGCATDGGRRAGEARTVGAEGRAAGVPFSDADIAWLDEVADTILPETDTPGAKAAGVGAFMALMVTDTYRPDEQARFVEGLEMLDLECVSMHGARFMAATPAQRLALLERVDAEQFEYMRARNRDEPVHYFRMIKELTLLGYFTSQIGYRQAMRYVETPGRFDPCVPYTPGDRAWAPHA